MVNPHDFGDHVRDEWHRPADTAHSLSSMSSARDVILEDQAVITHCLQSLVVCFLCLLAPTANVFVTT